MKRRELFHVLSLLVAATMILAACAPAATEVATEPPATEPPATEPPMAFEGMRVEAPSCDYGGILKSIEAVDPYTVVFTTCVPDPSFPAKAAFSSFQIYPSEYVESTGGGGEIVEHPIGTGPFVFEAWNRGDSIVLTRFDDYWGDPALSQTVVFRWSQEGAQKLIELQAGTVDGIDNVAPDDIATIQADPNLQLAERAPFNVFYVGFNNTYAPFDNEQVRQAIAMGIDRDRIVDTFYPPGSSVAQQFLPEGLLARDDSAAWYEFDAEAARALLAEAGFPDGFATTLKYRDVFRGYLPEPDLVAQDIAAQLKANLNIDVEIIEMESGSFLDASDAGQLEGLHLLGWTGDYPDPTNFYDFHFGAGASAQFGDKWDDITALLSQAGQLGDEEARRELYAQVNELIKTHVPMIPVAHGTSAAAYKATVQGAHASPLGNESLEVMGIEGQDTFTFMQNAEPPGLYCADETDGEALRVCEQVGESLLAYEVAGVEVVPSLAIEYSVNDDATVWTFTLRQGVKFHDGSDFDANDVVLSWAVQWDASHPLHVGRDGSFTYFSSLFGGLLNAP